MAGPTRGAFWVVWLITSLALIGWFSWDLLGADDKSLFMPGPLADGHHQLADDCGACHTDPLGGGEVLQKACIDCHGWERIKPLDSHPRGKFQDPRNAERLVNIDALHCVTCHTEHRPEITLADGLTQPRDLCFHCHMEIAEERPSHTGMDFMSCKNSGCHNFHDNRALYTDFLIKHLDEPATRKAALLPQRQLAQLVPELADYPHDRYPLQALGASAADAAAGHPGDAQLQRDWLETAHAKSGVNCSACHQPVDNTGVRQSWTDHPDQTSCAQCHSMEVQAFGRGRHGMRLAAGLSPMTTDDSRLPMQSGVEGKRLGCTSCHAAHRFDIVKAAAESCLGCHADDHSLAWKDSPHGRLWQKQLAGETPAGSGVSCAGCHLPREEQDVNDWMSRIVVQHNQSAVHSPNSKMIRPACLHCHGLEFSLDALADPELISRNFTGQPAGHVETMALAKKEQQRRDEKREDQGQSDTSMFGF
jgi:hypothetical protein